MKVTGNTLIAFEKWYIPYIRKQRRDYIQFNDVQVLRKFHRMIDDMKIGVFISFFDSVVIYISPVHNGLGEFGYEVDNNGITHIMTWTINRPEVNTKAVEKADELFNSRS